MTAAAFQAAGTMLDLLKAPVKARERRTGGACHERKALHQTLRRLLVDRFGSVPENFLQRIENITDADRLTTFVVQVWHVAAPEDLQL